ncbi:MAG: RAMP superfamily CRISPR-associated protein [Syntrophales bacterium]
MKKPYEPKTYYMLSLDPIHVGTGGYRLGRVDNTITREPGTNLPKIPGSSIAGVSRAYTAMAIQSENNEDPVRTEEKWWVIDYEKYKKWKYQRPDYVFLRDPSSDIIKYNSEGKAIITPNTNGPMIRKDENIDIYYSCAGKGANDGEGHCGSPDCEVCVAFGFSKQSGSFQGLAQFSDARILFFPVHSMIGPVWITCSSILKELAISANNGLTYDDEQILTNLVDRDKQLNLGWIYLKNKEKSPPIIDTMPKIPTEIFNRLVLVSDKLFPRIVNDNLEVRTSVAINPATGAAEEKALFTYEAIPRATVMCFDVVYNKPEYFRIKINENDTPIQT